MFKTIKPIVLAALCLSISNIKAQGPTKPILKNQAITGKVISTTTSEALPGAVIKITSTNQTVLANDRGEFILNLGNGSYNLSIHYLSYKTKILSIQIPLKEQLVITLDADNKSLKEVEIVSTGYQNIPKERATGSFVLINNELLNRSVGTNIINRLDGVTSGLIFNKFKVRASDSDISIRGRSTIFANTSPLVIVDNFPYDGDINNINPNDIESISILKDAAAASIWGARSGNGVIVITSKKGKAGDKIKISANVNLTISDRPDLHYQQQMNSSDFIDLEQYLFQKGHYNTTISNGYGSISPAVAIMLQKRNGQISFADSTAKINQLKTYDSRDELEKYIFRPAINQQYSLNLSGGSKTHLYYISAGYDKNLQNEVSNSYSRFTLNANNTYYLLNSKLQLFAGVSLTASDNKEVGNQYKYPNTPYDRLMGENGEHLAVVTANGLRKQYTDTAGKGQLLDWNYRPLDENYSNSISKLTDYKLNTNAKYTVLPGLEVSLSYQYQKGINDKSLLYASDSFYTRNMINTYTQLNQTTLVATRKVPLGAIDNIVNSNYYAHNGRAQLNYVKKFGDRHDLNLLAGFEVKDYQSLSTGNTIYGFNPSDASSIPVDFIAVLPQYFGTRTSQISYGVNQNYSIDRFRSAYFNGSYGYNDRYFLSVSARRDESNIFGVNANQKGVPLWSAGLLWDVSKEDFYTADLFPLLKLRLTYGYNGNVDRTTSAYLTARQAGRNNWQRIFYEVANPPNPSLRWERIKNVNMGLDYAFKNNLFSGSIDYFIKQGLDLIGNSPIEPQSGIIQFKGNSANTKTTGVDLVINKNSSANTTVKWRSNLLFSYNKEVVTEYKVEQGRNSDLIGSNYANPLEGYPFYAIFSYPYKGLDHMGKPQGWLNGQISQDYTAIAGSADISNMAYHGSATPTIYGSFRNSVSYQDFELSLNISYKLNYSFRRSLVFGGSSYSYQFADFDKRWQVQGDELKTNIPALTYPINAGQNNFVQGSSLLVEKGDHVRLEDIRLAYNFKLGKPGVAFKSIQAYTYINNVGILWKATKQNIDPDYNTASFVNPKTFSFGLSTSF